METMIDVMGSDPIIAIALGGWLFAFGIAYWAIKLIREQACETAAINARLMTIISNNTEAVTKLGILLDERTKYIAPKS